MELQQKSTVSKKLAFWITIVVIFGLFQFLIDYLMKFLNDEPFKFELFIQSGALLFFSSSLIASTAVDIWISKEVKTKLAHLSYSFLHHFMPLIIMSLIVIVYMASINTTPEQISNNVNAYEKKIIAQIGVFLASILYSIVAKNHVLIFEKNE